MNIQTFLERTAKRAKKKHIKFNLDIQWVSEKLSKGICEATGIEFKLKPSDTSVNPYYPSIDRIDSSLDYTKDNCQLVVVGFNNLKHTNKIEEVKMFCKGFVKYMEENI